MESNTNWELNFQKIMNDLDGPDGSRVMPEKVPGLKPTEEALRALGFFSSELHKKILRHPEKSIIVAGTNGKGSTCATLETLLSAAGKKVGLYTSPHLIDATERIRVGQKNISKQDFCRHHDLVKIKTKNLDLSHFEFLTALAISYFMENIPEYIILEVGMGGVWDATNAVPHGTCILTPMGMDHEAFLGKNLEEIAKNKLGVIREFEGITGKTNVIYFPLPKSCQELKLRKEAEVPSRWTSVAVAAFHVVRGNPPQWIMKIGSENIALSLLGRRAVENSSIALTAIKTLGFPAELAHELKCVKWPGRMECITYRGKKIYLSGDHNPQGIESLIEILEHFDYGHMKILFGMGRDKDFRAALTRLLSLPRLDLHLTQSPFKGLNIADYEEFQQRASWSEPDPILALDRLVAEANNNEVLLVTGSLYLVGKIKSHVGISH